VRRSREAGQITVEVVILIPIVLLMMYGAVMAGFAWYARNAMQIAASDALSLDQSKASGFAVAGDPKTVAIDLMKTLKVAVTNVDANPKPVPGMTGFVTWSVTGEVPGPFPGLTLKLEGHASGPLDGFRPQSDVAE
jgi:Flp pilus assembly protein TadG